MKIIYIILGIKSLILGVIGIVLPVLPTTPFLLLTTYFFMKGSDSFSKWFENTKLYQKYVVKFKTKDGMTFSQKIKILLFSDLMIIISFISISLLSLKILLIVLNVIKYYYFIHKIKTIKGVDDNGIPQQESSKNRCVKQLPKGYVNS